MNVVGEDALEPGGSAALDQRGAELPVARKVVGDAVDQLGRLLGREDIQRAIDKWYPRALDTFGKSDSRGSELAVAYGIRRWGNAELRRMYKEDIDAQLKALGLEVPPEDRGRKIF